MVMDESSNRTRNHNLTPNPRKKIRAAGDGLRSPDIHLESVDGDTAHPCFFKISRNSARVRRFLRRYR